MSLSTLNPAASLSFFDLIAAQTTPQSPHPSQQQRTAGSDQLLNNADDIERLGIDAYISSISRILQARAVCQQYEQAALTVAQRLSQRIGERSSPFNAAYVVRERRRQLMLMEDEMKRTKAVVDSERERIRQQRASIQHQAIMLRERFLLFAALQQQVAVTHRQHLSQLTASRSLSCLKLRIRRRKMIEQLLTIYPLHPVPPNRRPPGDDPNTPCYMIRGIRIPAAHAYQYEEQAATAFSYVAHLITLIASCYSVTLRYRLVYRSSRSYVWDDIVSGSMYPLYWARVERDRFELAITLLNKDIEQLRQAITERGEGYGMPLGALPMPPSADTATADPTAGIRGSSSVKGHSTLDNLKSLLDTLLPADEN